MKTTITRYERICKGTVTFATVLDHFCEVRQCINKYSMAGVALLIQLHATCAECKRAAAKCCADMRFGTWTQSYACFAVMVLDSIRLSHGLSHVEVKKRGLHHASCNQVLDDMARSGLSPKCVVEGIPEWASMHDNFAAVLERCQQQQDNPTSKASYAVLVQSATALDVRTCNRFGKRKTAKKVKKDIDDHLGAAAKKRDVCAAAPKNRKRSYTALEQELQKRNLNPRSIELRGDGGIAHVSILTRISVPILTALPSESATCRCYC